MITMSTNIHPFDYNITKKDRNVKFGHKSPVIWLTGLSGSGKTTLANALQTYLFDQNINSYVLDGDNVRNGMNKDLGFSENDRKENIRRISEVSNLFSDAGILTITAFISPFEQDRNDAKEIIKSDFIEVYLSTSIDKCEERDPKGLYKKVRNGEIKNFTGISSPYEPPKSPSLVIDTSNQTIQESVLEVINYLKINLYI
jgi:adenylylsulfate kinase